MATAVNHEGVWAQTAGLIQRDIDNLRASVPGLKAVLLVANDGQPIAHSLPADSDVIRYAALTAAAASVGKRVSKSLNVGTLSEISLVGTEGQIFIYSAGGKAVLAVVSAAGAEAGRVHLDARWTAREISEKL